ncbi:MAG: DUF1016 N-terminal domain-containing protein [Tannerellaceae bacterium]|nr:DUF1016 N-terminal domain-containing protein [Tannerellaceae bacterium]
MSALRTQFNWSQYKLLIQIDDTDKRAYYEYETLNNHWTGRELERQMVELKRELKDIKSFILK